MQARVSARTARLITSTAVPKVGRYLTAAYKASTAPGRLDARLVIVDEDQQITAAQADVDLVVFNGHGYPDVRIGKLPITALRTAPDGITAPGLVLGCCYGASRPVLDAVTPAWTRRRPYSAAPRPHRLSTPNPCTPPCSTTSPTAPSAP